jgi:iron(III) transport system substrate-binding protein
MKTLLFILFFGVVLLAGCEGQETLVIYTDRHYETDDAIYEAFERESGLTVEILSASADELIQRIQSEGENTPADLLFLTDVGRLERAVDEAILTPMDAAIVDAIPERYVHPDFYYTGVTKRARVLVYHPDRVDVSELSTYEALAEPSMENRVVIRSSQNVYNQSLFASLFELQGEAAFDAWLSGLKGNLARRPAGNDRDQAKAVFAGEADVAIMNTYYMGKMAFSDDPFERDVARALEVFFPNQDTTGTHVNITGLGVVKHADNVEAAEALITYLLSENVQNVFASTNYEYPVLESATLHPYIEAWGAFIEQTIPLSRLGDLYPTVSMKVDELRFDQ